MISHARRPCRAMSPARSAFLVTATLLALGACRATQSSVIADDLRSPVSASSSADTIRGVLTVVGSDPFTTVMLTSRQGLAIALSGAAAPALRDLAGVEVMLRGLHRPATGEAGGVDRTPSNRPSFEARQFAVRAVDGIAAVDGTLERAGAGYALRMIDARSLELPALPAALRTHVGARIFLAGPLDRAPQHYGIIAAPR